MKILWIDTEAKEYGLMTGLKRHYAVEVRLTATGGLGRLRKRNADYSLVILEISLLRGRACHKKDAIPKRIRQRIGEYLLECIAKRWPSLPVIVLTGCRSNLDGLELPPKCELIRKPAGGAEVLDAIERLTQV